MLSLVRLPSLMITLCTTWLLRMICWICLVSYLTEFSDDLMLASSLLL